MSILFRVLSCFAIATIAMVGLSPVRAEQEEAKKDDKNKKPKALRYHATLHLPEKGVDRLKVVEQLTERAKSHRRIIAFKPSADAQRITMSFLELNEDDARARVARIIAQSPLALRPVHPRNERLAPGVAKCEKVVPGYRLYKHEGVDDLGNKFSHPLLLEKGAELSGLHIRRAVPDPGRAGVINVELTKKGGKFMHELTEPMKKGEDRLAIVLDGVVRSAPVVQGTLFRHFVITGMDDNQERKDLAAALMAPISAQLVLESLTVAPAAP